MTSFSSVFIEVKTNLVCGGLWNYQFKLSGFHLENHCSHCSNVSVIKISIINVFIWLTTYENSTLTEIEKLIPEWIFSVRSSKCRFCIQWNGSSTNWGIVTNVFLNEMVLSGRNDDSLCYGLHLIEFHRSIGKQVHSSMVIIVLGSKLTSVDCAINNLKTYVGVVANHVRIKYDSD